MRNPSGLSPRNLRRLFGAWLAFSGAGLMVFGVGCSQPSATASRPSPSQQSDNKQAGQAVEVVRPLRKTVRHPIRQPGFNIEAFEQTALYPKIQGYVRQWKADIGDRVRKDQLLAKLYVPEMEVDLKRKQAAVAEAKARVRQARAAIRTARAQLERARSQYKRFTRLGKKQGVVDQESIDETKFGYHAAQAAVEKAEADEALAQAQVAVAEGDRDYVATLLKYAEVRAPFDGVVTQRNVNRDDLVRPTGIRGKPLFVVEQTDPVRVFVNVPGADAVWIKKRNPVTLRLRGAGGEIFRGQVTRNAGVLDPQSRTLRTEIDLPNPRGKLLPGMYVQAVFTVEHPRVWTLPAAAVITEGDETFCFQVINGKVVRTPLQVGLSGGNRVEILKMWQRPTRRGRKGRWQNPTGREQVVRENVGWLKDGQKVTISR
jgi:RND family efflux transporter MFP subunit